MSTSVLDPLSAQDERLAAIQEHSTLDDRRAETYHDISRVAAAVCAAPIALVMFSGLDAIWFGSTEGALRSVAAPTESFCAHTIRASGLLEVQDTTRDSRFATHPIVVGEEAIRFFAGVALVREGQRAAALSVMDTVPRSLTPQQREGLISLGRATSHFLDLRRSARRLSESLEAATVLSGLISICVHCKRVRGERGRLWDRIERYFESRSSARFSHGICPECTEEHYADLFVPELTARDTSS